LAEKLLDEIDGFENLEKTTNEFIEEISQKIEELSGDIISKNEDIVVFKQNIKSAQKPLNELDGVDNKCPVCQSDLDEEKKLQLIQQY
jgi:exonuclease SbcC